MSSTIVTVNPATGAELATYQAMTQAEIDSALDTAAAAQRGWAGEDFTVRAEILRAAAELLRERDDELAVLVTREMGKPLAELGRRGAQVRRRVGVLRRTRPDLPGRRGLSDGRGPQLGVL